MAMLADSTTDAAGALAGLMALYVILGIAFYFLPTIIAVARGCRSTGSVVIINIFLGWTLIGWVVALAMAFGTTRRDSYGHVVNVYSPAPGPVPPATTHMSPDGRFWWDGAAWRDAATSAPATAPRSPDGMFWWDGGTWRAVPSANLAAG
jgi:hypothetical protein